MKIHVWVGLSYPVVSTCLLRSSHMLPQSRTSWWSVPSLQSLPLYLSASRSSSGPPHLGRWDHVIVQIEKHTKHQRISFQFRQMEFLAIPFTGYWMSPLLLLLGQRVKMAINVLSNQLQKSIVGLGETPGDICSLHPPPHMAYNFLMLTKDIFFLPSGTVQRGNQTGSRD